MWDNVQSWIRGLSTLHARDTRPINACSPCTPHVCTGEKKSKDAHAAVQAVCSTLDVSEMAVLYAVGKQACLTGWLAGWLTFFPRGFSQSGIPGGESLPMTMQGDKATREGIRNGDAGWTGASFKFAWHVVYEMEFISRMLCSMIPD